VVSGETTDTVLQVPCCLLGSKQDVSSAANSILLLLSKPVKGSRNTSHFVSMWWMLAFTGDPVLLFGEIFFRAKKMA